MKRYEKMLIGLIVLFAIISVVLDGTNAIVNMFALLSLTVMCFMGADGIFMRIKEGYVNSVKGTLYATAAELILGICSIIPLYFSAKHEKVFVVIFAAFLYYVFLYTVVVPVVKNYVHEWKKAKDADQKNSLE